MDWRKLKVGQILWYVNTTPWDYDSPRPSSCLDLWKGTVMKIDPKADRPVTCRWKMVGGNANWVAPEYGWGRMHYASGDKNIYKNPNVFPTAEEAIEAYPEGPRTKLLKQAYYLKGTKHGTA